MTYREWKSWLGRQPWSLRWFLILVLIRPVLDLLYFLKSVSPFLSPLYIVGAATPVLIIASYFSRRFPRIRSTVPDLAFVILSGLFLFNAVAVLTLGIEILTLEIVFKLMTPVLIYFFVRHLIQSKQDLHGLLTTFLYSTIVPIGMLLYESLIDPFQSGVVHTREFDRFNGLYADVMSYAIYVIGAFLIVSYFFLRSVQTPAFKRSAYLFAGVSIVTLVSLVNMHHASSWAVFGGLSLLLMFHLVSVRLAPVLLMVCGIGLAGYLLFGAEVQQRVSTMFSTEMAVLDDEEQVGRVFHGRGYRWMRYVDEWNEAPITAKLVGISVADRVPDRSKLLSGTHNDYFRIGFATGMIGLAMYLFALMLFGFAALRKPRGEKFLVLGAMAIVMLYSITTTPTMYAPLMYLCLSVFAYGAIDTRAEDRR